MKVAPPPASSVGTLEGEEIRFDLDRTAISHLMRVLTKLYEDPELACIREYSTNARDSHIEAGQDRPIEVTTPTFDEPMLVIQDFGIGMSIDDLRRTFSQYGSSTKRESNDVQGMLGLGSKSALAYTDQFTLEAVQDGVACVAVAYQDAGAPKIKVVDEYMTDEPNGVKVSIPAKPTNKMFAKAQEFFSYWDPEHVLLNGERPEVLNGTRISDTFMLCEGQYGDQDRVLMGGVAYPTPYLRERGISLKPGGFIVAKVDMGEVSFTPSREALELDETTNKRIIALVDQFKTELSEAISESLKDAQTPYEAVALSHKWNKFVDHQEKIVFDGKEIPLYIELPEGSKSIYRWMSNDYGDLNSLSKVKVDNWADTVWVTGFRLRRLVATHRRKLDKWLEDKDFEPKRFVFVPDSFENEWIDEARIVPWETIRALWVPRDITTRSGGPSGRLRGSYDVLTADGLDTEVPADEIDDYQGPLFYMSNRAGDVVFRGDVLTMIPDATIVLMGMNRFDKFQRDFPESRQITKQFVATYVAKWVTRLHSSMLISMAIRGDWRNQSFYHSVGQYEVFADPRFAKLIRCAKLDTRKEYDLWTRWRWELKSLNKVLPDIPNIFQDYPLIDGSHIDHSKLYVQAVWDQKQNQV